jgi:hypothetical protein
MTINILKLSIIVGIFFTRVLSSSKFSLNFVVARDVSFADVCNKRRSFRDKYEEGAIYAEVGEEIFGKAVGVIVAYEHATGKTGIIEEYQWMKEMGS